MTNSNFSIFSRAVVGECGVVEEYAADGQEGERRRVAGATQEHGHQRVLPHGETNISEIYRVTDIR